MRNLLSPMLAATLILSSSTISKAGEVDLKAVSNQLSMMLVDVSDLSKVANRHAIPMRTNEELEAIAIQCETILSGNNTDVEIPAICAAIDLPYNGVNEEPYKFANNKFVTNVVFSSK